MRVWWQPRSQRFKIYSQLVYETVRVHIEAQPAILTVGFCVNDQDSSRTAVISS